MTNKTEYELALYGTASIDVKHISVDYNTYPILSVMLRRFAGSSFGKTYDKYFWRKP